VKLVKRTVHTDGDAAATDLVDLKNIFSFSPETEKVP
jgi:hypothetical protein